MLNDNSTHNLASGGIIGNPQCDIMCIYEHGCTCTKTQSNAHFNENVYRVKHTYIIHSLY